MVISTLRKINCNFNEGGEENNNWAGSQNSTTPAFHVFTVKWWVGGYYETSESVLNLWIKIQGEKGAETCDKKIAHAHCSLKKKKKAIFSASRN